MAARRTTAADADLGVRIAAARKEAGFTQKQLGAALGVTMQQVQKYEAGANRIAATVLASVARVTGKPVAWFYEAPGPQPCFSVADRVRKLAIEHLGVEQDRAVERALLVQDLGADSLDLVELQVAIEDEFEIDVGEDYLTSTMTLGDVGRLVERHIAPVAAAA